MTMKLGIYGDYRTYKVKITDNSKPAVKTRTLRNKKVILTEKESFRLIKSI